MSDLHANGLAIDRALTIAHAAAPDRLVILGDLLTYGVDVDETIDRIGDAVVRYKADLVLGNHDQLYLDLDDRKTGYYDALPEWIRESVDKTGDQLDVTAFKRDLPWSRDLRLGNTYLAHANPFGYGDWTYLNSQPEIVRAGTEVARLGFEVGIFGHNHRPAVRRCVDGRASTVPLGVLEFGASFVLNAGSVGQPRDAERISTLLVLDIDDHGTHVQIESVEYDVAAHLGRLKAASFSATTLRRLCAFFSGGSS